MCGSAGLHRNTNEPEKCYQAIGARGAECAFRSHRDASTFHLRRFSRPLIRQSFYLHPRQLSEQVNSVVLSVCRKIPFSSVFAGQAAGIREVHHDIWLVTFMDYDLGYFDLETRVLEPLENPFGPKVLPI